MEARSWEVGMIKRNSDKCKISTPTPRAALMVVMVDRVEAAADTAAMVDKEEIAGVIVGTDNQSRV